MSDFVQQQHSVCRFDSSESWVILSPIEQSIKRKIEAAGIPLKDWDIQINYGIKTGCNEAFIISTEKRTEILANCKDDAERQRTDELIRPILRGRDIKRYGYVDNGLYLINTHNGIRGRLPRIKIEDYPAVKAHLDQYWDKIVNRADQGDTPYNLRNCAYLEDFYQPKIVWKRIGSILRFGYDNSGALGLDSTCFATGKNIEYICCLLNSPIGHYLLKDSPKTGTGDLLISVQAVEPIKVPSITTKDNEELNIYMQTRQEERINRKIFEFYNLSLEEMSYIEKYFTESQ